MPDITQEKMDQIAELWNARGEGLITHMALDIRKVSAEGVLVRMPFNPDFCVDSDQTLLHGGILTALLDSVFGL
ncbi:MAG: PaaI family thioesterase, partial [Defluviimonas sp.]|nr:PaaI family thioesterase [Defluviimonas sp.]